MINKSEQKFLSQSYQDAISDYQTMLASPRAACWDWVIITASDQAQADAFQLQLNRRKEEGILCPRTEYAVVPDTNGKRIGSGGATLNVLRYVGEQVGFGEIAKQKILICHSGGDSKRIPQYSVCGKLFAPVPRLLSTGKPSTVFDEIVLLSAAIPARINAGMLVVPSDTMILFNPVQLDLLSCDASGLSIKTSIEIGQEHGVYVEDEDGMVTRFLHKQSEKVLRTAGAVDIGGNVNVDTGLVWFGSDLVNALRELISENNLISEGLFQKYVNEKVCLSFYADLLFPLAEKATLADYLNETPENILTDELLDCRRLIWAKLRDYRLSLVKLNPSKYIHFGTQREFFDMLVWHSHEYSFLGWKRQVKCGASKKEHEAVIINSLLHVGVITPKNCYIENSDIREGCIVGSNTMLSGISAANISIPEKTVMHCVQLENGNFVCRILGLDDNPKNSIGDSFLAGSIDYIFRQAGIDYEGLTSIWDAELFEECTSAEAAAEAAINLWQISHGRASEKEIEGWKNAKRHSLKSSFREADVQALLNWNENIEHRINVNGFISALSDGMPLYDALPILEYSGDSNTELMMLLEYAHNADFPFNMRVYHALSVLCRKHNRILDGMDYNVLEDLTYGTVKDVIVPVVYEKHPFRIRGFLQDEITVELPVRVNFCGSPSDAAPYCLEHGGTMFDGALLLKGRCPIKATVKRLDEPIIILESVDLKARKSYSDINEIKDCGNPYDTFALHKAVLVSTGIFNIGDDLSEVLKQIGGGMHLSTFADVPKGSGLGTSSIVAAACLKAINEILGQDISDERIYAQVFSAEQLMNTGGGWQDQTGAFTPGLKLIKSSPGVYQKMDIEYAELQNKDELNRRFALIFSGQRRLARNVLREELNRCIENDKVTMDALDRIRSICVLMKFELERGNITRFAKYITEQFELTKTIDKGASNTYIEYIFEACDDLIDGKSICGAGGGGFLQVVLKEEATKGMLKKRLESVFKDCGVLLWECTLI